MMTLLEGAGEFVLFCTAMVIGAAVATVAIMWAWDKWQGRKWERKIREGRR